MQTYLTHASVILDYVDVLYLENGNGCRPVLKNNTATTFVLKKTFQVSKCHVRNTKDFLSVLERKCFNLLHILQSPTNLTNIH